jgi:hypothetical protein
MANASVENQTVTPPAPVPARSGGFLIAMLRVAAGGALAGVIISTAVLSGAQPGLGEDSIYSPIELVEGAINIFQAVVFLITAGAFLRWMYRASLAARALGATGLAISPGWAVGWFFVPIAMFWKPFQAMKQLWHGSRNPRDRAAQRPPAAIAIWWTLWLLTLGLGQVYFHLTLRGQSLATLAQSCGLLADLLDVPLCLLLVRLVSEIDARQRDAAHHSPRSWQG